jgi:hypothetical protein
MLKNKSIVFIALAGAVLAASSCRKFLNVNTNPNVSQTATVQTLLPAAQLYVGTSVGVDLEINGSFWSQYWTQSISASQYHILDEYGSIGQDQFLTPWQNLYAAAENFYQLYKLADTQKRKQYMAVSLLMQAYTFQLITDGWGDVPFTQALKGQVADGGIVNPKYDSQLVVYNGIMAYIDSANKLINSSDPLHPGSDDLIYGGSMSQWQKFSNTLMLKILLRISMREPSVAQTGITALYATTPLFIGNGDDAKIGYGYNSANNNPLYAEESSTTLGGTQNLIGSATCIDSMNSNHDPRESVFYEPAPATVTATFAGNYIGLEQGLYSGSYSINNFSVPNVYVAGDAHNAASGSAPVNFLTSWESDFLQAEVVARGLAVTGVTDDSLFYHGILASFNYYATDLFATTQNTPLAEYNSYVAGGGYWTVYPASGTPAQKLRFIITQKWFAMCGNQGFEAWTEWRRTGYPDFLIQSATGVGAKPERFLYPTTESTTNANFPGEQLITAKVWWDVN